MPDDKIASEQIKRKDNFNSMFTRDLKQQLGQQLYEVTMLNTNVNMLSVELDNTKKEIISLKRKLEKK